MLTKFLNCSSEDVDVTFFGNKIHIFGPKHSRLLASRVAVYEIISKPYFLETFTKRIFTVFRKGLS